MKRAKFHYAPPGGYTGDVIPFYWQGQYHVFYLEGQLDPWRRVRYTPYRHLVSSDLVAWSELALALPLGGPDEIDMSLGTGTILERGGLFYMLYCGRVFAGPRRGLDEHWEASASETVCLATSPDLVHWTKDPANPILRPDGQVYPLSDFRDPFPFWNAADGRYWMLVAAKTAGALRPGALALAVSDDLRHWELRPPFNAPHLSATPPECPDIFQAAGRWHLYVSSDGRTMQRFAETLEGPWQRPHPDLHDYWNVYALKTLFDGQRRFLVGWLGTKQGDRDSGQPQWGGHLLIPRELQPLPDGLLAERCPAEILAACGPALPIQVLPQLGEWQACGGDWCAARRDGLALAWLEGLPELALVEAELVFDLQACAQGAAGLFFRAAPDLGSYYALRLEPARRRVLIERWPHVGEFSVLSERPLRVEPGRPVRLQLFIAGDIAEAFVNEEFALSCRVYDLSAGLAGLFAEFGGLEIRSLRVRALPQE